MKCEEITKLLESLSPKKYASSWDNVGLLVGRREKEVSRIAVSLDASFATIEEAVKAKADMLITHHPMIFSSLKQINEDQITSEKILTLIENGIACYAMHTNFDTIGGMGELAAGPEYLDLSDSEPLIFESDDIYGMGRGGYLPTKMTAKEVADYVKKKFGLSFVMLYQDERLKGKQFDKIAVLPGSGKSEMEDVRKKGYELYLTGDYGHHPGIDAMDMGMTIIDATHYGLEHIFVSFIAKYLRDNCNCIEVVEIDTGCPVQIL